MKLLPSVHNRRRHLRATPRPVRSPQQIILIDTQTLRLPQNLFRILRQPCIHRTASNLSDIRRLLNVNTCHHHIRIIRHFHFANRLPIVQRLIQRVHNVALRRITKRPTRSHSDSTHQWRRPRQTDTRLDRHPRRHRSGTLNQRTVRFRNSRQDRINRIVASTHRPHCFNNQVFVVRQEPFRSFQQRFRQLLDTARIPLGAGSTTRQRIQRAFNDLTTQTTRPRYRQSCPRRNTDIVQSVASGQHTTALSDPTRSINHAFRFDGIPHLFSGVAANHQRLNNLVGPRQTSHHTRTRKIRQRIRSNIQPQTRNEIQRARKIHPRITQHLTKQMII